MRLDDLAYDWYARRPFLRALRGFARRENG